MKATEPSELIDHHVEEEEGEMFPSAERLGRARLAELGAEPGRRFRSTAQPERALRSGSSVPPHRHTVLVVDDSEDHRDAVVQYLETVDIESHAAASGAAALAQLETGLRPCAILADLAMPEMDGWEFIARLRRYPELAELEVVMYSGFPADADRAAAAGVRRYLMKPLHPQRAVAAVDEFCRARRR